MIQSYMKYISTNRKYVFFHIAVLIFFFFKCILKFDGKALSVYMYLI